MWFILFSYLQKIRISHCDVWFPGNLVKEGKTTTVLAMLVTLSISTVPLLHVLGRPFQYCLQASQRQSRGNYVKTRNVNRDLAILFEQKFRGVGSVRTTNVFHPIGRTATAAAMHRFNRMDIYVVGQLGIAHSVPGDPTWPLQKLHFESLWSCLCPSVVFSFSPG